MSRQRRISRTNAYLHGRDILGTHKRVQWSVGRTRRISSKKSLPFRIKTISAPESKTDREKARVDHGILGVHSQTSRMEQEMRRATNDQEEISAVQALSKAFASNTRLIRRITSEVPNKNGKMDRCRSQGQGRLPGNDGALGSGTDKHTPIFCPSMRKFSCIPRIVYFTGQPSSQI